MLYWIPFVLVLWQIVCWRSEVSVFKNRNKKSVFSPLIFRRAKYGYRALILKISVIWQGQNLSWSLWGGYLKDLRLLFWSLFFWLPQVYFCTQLVALFETIIFACWVLKRVQVCQMPWVYFIKGFIMQFQKPEVNLVGNAVTMAVLKHRAIYSLQFMLLRW